MDAAARRLINENELVQVISQRFGNDSHKLQSLSLKHLQTISSELISEIYLAYLKYFNVEISLSLPSNPDHMVNLGSVQEQLLFCMDLTTVLKHVLKNMGLTDFNVNDILNPMPKRSLYILSLLENYALFYEDKQTEISGEIENIAAMVEKHQALIKQREDLRQKKNDQASNRALRDQKIKQLKDKINAEQNSTKSFADDHKEVSDVHDSITTKLHMAKQQFENKKEENILQRQGIAQLSKQIAPSPAQLNADLKTNQNNLDQLKELVEEHKVRLQSQSEACTLRESLIEWERKKDVMLQEAKKLRVELLNEHRSDMKKEMKTECGDELEALQDEISFDTNTIKGLEEKMTALQLQKERKLISQKKSVAREEREKNEMAVKCNELQHQNEQLLKCLAKVEEEGNDYLHRGHESANLLTTTKNELVVEYDHKQAARCQQWDIVLTNARNTLQQTKEVAKKMKNIKKDI